MSEIPLRQFGRPRKARAGYTALAGDEQASGSSEPNGTMPPAVRNAAVSARVAKKSRRADRYEDDPEEEETLLGNESHDLAESEAVPRETTSRVRTLHSYAVLEGLSSARHRPSHGTTRLQGTSREQFRFDRQVRQSATRSLYSV